MPHVRLSRGASCSSSSSTFSMSSTSTLPATEAVTPFPPRLSSNWLEQELFATPAPRRAPGLSACSSPITDWSDDSPVRSPRVVHPARPSLKLATRVTEGSAVRPRQSLSTSTSTHLAAAAYETSDEWDWPKFTSVASPPAAPPVASAVAARPSNGRSHHSRIQVCTSGNLSRH